MLDNAETRAQAAEDGERITLVRGNGERGLPFRDASFDLVYAESVIGLLDIEQVIPECARIIRPSGRLDPNERQHTHYLTHPDARYRRLRCECLAR